MSAVDNQGRTPVHYLFDKENLVLSQTALQNNSDGTKSKIKCYISKFLYVQDNLGYIPLHLAAMRWGRTAESLEGFRILVETFQPKLNSPLTDFDESILHVAVISRNRELVKYLLSLPDIDLDIQDRSGRTAIEYVRGDAELQAAFNRISDSDLEKIHQNYCRTRTLTFFENLFGQEKSDPFLEKLKTEVDPEKRFKQVQEYVRRKPDEVLAQVLRNDVPGLSM